MKVTRILVGLAIVMFCALLPPWIASTSSHEATQRDLVIRARQYAFDPPRITVNKGDEVHIRLASLDVIHGFYLEGYDIDAQIEPGVPTFRLRRPSQGTEYASAEEIVFTATRSGKFRYRCSHTCGSLHPFMQGELIVQPNPPYLAGMGGSVGVLIAAFTLFIWSARSRHSEPLKEGTTS